MSNTVFKFNVIALLAAIGLYVIIEPNNLGFSPDSMAYLEMAENFSSGRGISDEKGQVVDHWPPGFPIVLSIVSDAFGINHLEVGKIVQPMLIFCFVLLFFLILKELRLRNLVVLWSGILLIFAQIGKNFLYFLSEGLFLVLLLLSFYTFQKWLHRRSSIMLIVTGLLCGLFFLTRYAGIGIISGYLLFILLDNKFYFRKSSKEILFFLFPIIIVVLPWFLYVAGFEENPEGRKAAIHIISFSKLSDLFITFAYWFLGSFLARVGIFILLLFYWFCWINKKISFQSIFTRMYKKYERIILVSFIMILSYPIFLIFSISFYDAWTPLDNRILSPVFPFILILIALYLDSLLEQKKNRLFYSTACILLISFVSSVLPSYFQHYKIGSGYTKKQWRQSEIIQFLKERKEDIPTFSNGVEFGALFLEKDFKLLPPKNRYMEIQNLAREVKEGNAQIVFFCDVDWRNYVVSQEVLLHELEEVQKREFEDGFILKKFTSE